MQTVQGKLRTAWRRDRPGIRQTAFPRTARGRSEIRQHIYHGRAGPLLEKLARDGKLSQTYPYPVQVWHLGDLQITTLGGEVVVDYAVRLKSELPGTANWIGGYCNDVMAYIPSARVLKEGGYEGETAMIYYGLPTKWSEDVEEHIVKTVMELAKE